MFEVGLRVKEMRERAGLSQNRLAKRAGCAQSTLSAIESTTKKPSTETLRGIARALGCTVAELMGESADEEPDTAEATLLRAFRALNEVGQAELIKRALEYTEITRYTEKSMAISG